MVTAASRPRVAAVLGPTNTGKTHFAMERMLGHASGMIGFPLRLLARENYDRAVRAKGARSVALITGEEKIVPAEARYLLCTVESMPVDRRVAFVGVDEIQMCADPDRGHVFTDRLLHARGGLETLFMGAETIRPLIRRLVPEAEIITRPRFSTLSYSGSRKLQRLPPRTAIVAFSVADVYAIAELIRRQRGGTAVVLGALSPHTRNAQVAMYQAGEVDYLVATDAIGMGLNMDLNHVAFAETRKFDGHYPRPLTAAELAQIAGRAGRHMNDGTFGTTADAGALDPDMVSRVENHRFDPLRRLYWRNDALMFASLDALLTSLARTPTTPGLTRIRRADDEDALAALARDAEIVALARHPAAVRLLWDVCQIPDFRKVMSDAHAQLLGRIYRHLMGPDGRGDCRLPASWVARQVDRIDRVDGDIEALMQRIANIRTWTYVSYRADWVDDAAGWQQRTRSIEDKLSDALHRRLMQRFVDRRSSILLGRMRSADDLASAVSAAGDVMVEDEFVGTLEGFRFTPDPGVTADSRIDSGPVMRLLNAAALRALRTEIPYRLRRMEADPDDAFAVTPEGAILWHDAPVARLAAGADVLQPKVEPETGDMLEPAQRERLRRRLADWLERYLEAHLALLFKVRRAGLAGAAGGIAFQVTEALGSLARRQVATQIAALSRDDRKALARIGIKIGRESVHVPRLLKPQAIALRGLLWATHHGVDLPALPPPGRVTVAMQDGTPPAFYGAIGYLPLGRAAVRVDMAERAAARANALARGGDFEATQELCGLLGCGAEDLIGILAALGYEPREGSDSTVFRRAPRRQPQATAKQGNAKRERRSARPEAHSPFAKLRRLVSPT
ncbi:MAG: disulfide oxidoreductase [Rhodospirillales bacterium]|nr:disulfide oxidoreductase [Rhodospirillales bacterium]